MKRFLTIPVLAGLLFFIGTSGLSAAEIKIGVIDTQKIMMQSKKTAELRTQFLKDLDTRRNEVLDKQKAAQALEEELKAKAADMTYEERRDKTDLLTRRVKEFNRMKEELDEEAKRRDEDLGRRFIRDVGDILRDYQKKEKYTIIMEKGAIVAYDESIDITDKIIEIYDSRD